MPPDATLADALLAMQETGTSCLAVGQGDCPIGIVSQRDIVREKCRLEEQEEFHSEMRSATGLLQITRNSPPIRSGQRLCEAAAAMVDHSLPAVTVVNQSNRLLGLVTEDDLLREYAGGKLDFEPGTKWSYSNTGYILLGRVVEIISGEKLGAFLARRPGVLE